MQIRIVVFGSWKKIFAKMQDLWNRNVVSWKWLIWVSNYFTTTNSKILLLTKKCSIILNTIICTQNASSKFFKLNISWSARFCVCKLIEYMNSVMPYTITYCIFVPFSIAIECICCMYVCSISRLHVTWIIHASSNVIRIYS